MTYTPAHRLAPMVVLFAALAGSNGWSATEPRPIPPATKSAAAASTKAGAARAGAARGILPDPALLDGSTQPAEKKSEHGMIGDFELPGDDNVRSGKVGGPQNQNPPAAGGGQQSNLPMGMPQGGGAGGQQSPQGQQQQGGGAQGGEQSAQNGGQQPGGPQNPAGANQASGAGDPGAQPQGIQVAELGGADGQQQPAGGANAPGQKPPAVAIGDSAMRIEPSAGAPAASGPNQQAAGHTQQHEKGTGSGGKGSGGAQSGNRVEKGRAIPSGL